MKSHREEKALPQEGMREAWEAFKKRQLAGGASPEINIKGSKEEAVCRAEFDEYLQEMIFGKL